MTDTSELKSLKKLAQFYGIQLSYINDFGRRQYIEPEVLLKLLQVMGCSITDTQNTEQCWIDEQMTAYRNLLDPIYVIWDTQPPKASFYIHIQQKNAQAEFAAFLENGSIHHWKADLAQLDTVSNVSVNQDTFVRKQILLPLSLPYGYHRLSIKVNQTSSEALLIVAPSQLKHTQTRPRLWGTFTPLYAIKSHRNWGIGDTTDLKHLIQWQAQLGARLIGTLPLFANYLETPYDHSPYAPVTRLFGNEIYIDISQIEAFQRCESAQSIYRELAAQGEFENLRASHCVNYPQVYQIKKRILRLLSDYFFEHHHEDQWEAFQNFLRRYPNVQAYARFRAYQEETQTLWDQWSLSKRNQIPESSVNPAHLRYHLFCQWQFYNQLQQIKETSDHYHTQLYLDLPVGCHPYGFDTWYFASSFVHDVSIGAPPDRVFTQGQNWNVTPIHPHKIRQNRYEYFIECLRAVMPYVDILRLDHIMQFHRLFWIPRDFPANKGAFVRYHNDEFYALLCLEAMRHNVDLVGENLGTVPEVVNRKMDQHKVKRMFVLQYELDSRDTLEGLLPSKQTIASLNTHDMPTFMGYCLGSDLKHRQQMRLITRQEALTVYHQRKFILKQLVTDFYEKGLLEDTKIKIYRLLKSALFFLASEKSRYMLINLDDIWGETHQQNVPGTHTEYPNWQHKLRYPLEEFDQLTNFKYILRIINDIRK